MDAGLQNFSLQKMSTIQLSDALCSMGYVSVSLVCWKVWGQIKSQYPVIEFYLFLSGFYPFFELDSYQGPGLVKG
jgi:hypothetical protein